MQHLFFNRVAPLVASLALGMAFVGSPPEDPDRERRSKASRSRNSKVPLPTPSMTLTASTFIPVPSTIDATGATDVTNSLQRFLNKVPNGTVVRFRPEGRYRVEGTLKLINRALTIEAQHATIFATQRGAGNRSQWLIQGGGHIIIRNMVVRGANPNAGTSDNAYVPALEHQHGFRVEGVQGLELDRVEVTDTYGDFVYLTRDAQVANNVWIHDSTFRRNGRQGIAAVAARNVIIERNTFGQTRRATIDLEPGASTFVVSNVFVLDNTVGVGRLLFVAAHGVGVVNNVLIHGNRMVGHGLTIDVLPPGGQRRSNWVVSNNTTNLTTNQRQLRFFRIDGLAVTNNTLHISSVEPALVVENSCGIHLARNEFGPGTVDRRGPVCAAPLTIPKAPNIPGRP